MSREHCIGVHIGPVYGEYCSGEGGRGDINIGIEAAAYGGIGYEAGGGGYCEATYNRSEGLSYGCGVSASAGVGIESPIGGAYANETVSLDSRDK